MPMVRPRGRGPPEGSVWTARGRCSPVCAVCAYGPGAARASARPGNQHDEIILASDDMSQAVPD